MKIELSSSLAAAIRDHGSATYPQECCGFLVGTAEGHLKKVAKLRKVENARGDSRNNRYLISPADFVAAEREAQSSGLDILGVYHSHPDHPAKPSEFDRENAFPWYSYIIVGVSNGHPADMTSWQLTEDRSAFEAESLEITQ